MKPMKPYVWKAPTADFQKRLTDAVNWLNDPRSHTGLTSSVLDQQTTHLQQLLQALDMKDEEKNGAYWERNMLALQLATFMNDVVRNLLGSKEDDPDYHPCGWYRHPRDPGDESGEEKYWQSRKFSFHGWSRVISINDGRMTFHVPDDFDVGELPQIEPNWDGHDTHEKWVRVMESCGCEVPDDKQD